MENQKSNSDWINNKSPEFLKAMIGVLCMIRSGEPEASVIQFFRDEIVLDNGKEASIKEATLSLQYFLAEMGVDVGELYGLKVEPMNFFNIIRYDTAIGVKINLFRIFPEMMGRLRGDYASLSGEEKVSLTSVFALLHVDEKGIASGIKRRIESIREEKSKDPDFLLGEKDMEYLRMALYVIDSLKLGDELFCEFGKALIRDLRAFVSEYEGGSVER